LPATGPQIAIDRLILRETVVTEEQKTNIAHSLQYFTNLLREGVPRSEAFERASQHLDFIERKADDETIISMHWAFAQLSAEIT
jgi:hypothetical protein